MAISYDFTIISGAAVTVNIMVFFGFSPPWSSPDVTRVKETGERWKGMGGLLFFLFVVGHVEFIIMVSYLIDLVGRAVVLVATRCGEKAREGRLGGGGVPAQGICGWGVHKG